MADLGNSNEERAFRVERGMKYILVRLDDARFGGGPGVVLSLHEESTYSLLCPRGPMNKLGGRDLSLRVWLNSGYAVGDRVSL